MKILVKNNQGGVVVKTTIDSNTFIEPGQGLYAWNFESAINSGILKFGQYGANATDGKLPQDTITSYVGATTEPIIILWAHRLTDSEVIAVKNAYDLEHKMQPLIGPKTIDGKSTETFQTTVDKIKEVFSEVVYGSKKLLTYPPRQRQQEAIDKCIDAFKTDNEFLLGAIMRFGKNFTFLNIAKQVISDNGNILVLTNKPGVFSSLKNDIESHVYFDGWNYSELKRNKDWKPSEGIDVLAVSKQLADNVTSGVKVRQTLAKTHFDIIMVDECHSGTDTDNFKSLLESLDYDKIVWASGTPFKTVSSRGFTKTNSYFYDYPDQQKDKRDGKLADAVTLDCYIPSIDSKIANNYTYYNEDDQFTLTKLFSIENGKLLHGGDVDEFLKDMLGKSNKPSKFSPLRKIELVDHMVVLLPMSQETIKAVASKAKAIVGDDYEVLVATGNESVDIKELQDAINRGKKTISMTCMRWIEGTTVPEWKMAINLSDTESIEKYLQFIFRLCTPAPNKDKAYVIDYNPQHTAKMIFEWASEKAYREENDDPSTAIREYLECYNVYRASESGPQFKEMDVEYIMNQIRNSDYSAETLLKTNRYVDFSRPEIAMFKDTGSLDNVMIKSFEFSDNGIDESPNYKILNKKESDKQQKSELELAKKNIKALMSRLPIVSRITGYKTVEDIIENVEADEFKDGVDVDKKWLELLVNKKIIDTYYVNIHLNN
jgi:superfamily II DNA or RNA helicase